MYIKIPSLSMSKHEETDTVPDEDLRTEEAEQDATATKGTDEVVGNEGVEEPTNDKKDTIAAVEEQANGKKDSIAATTSCDADTQKQEGSVEKVPLLIPGQCRTRLSRLSTATKGLREDTNTYEFYTYIYDKYGLNQSHVTEELYETFSQRGYKPNEISRYLHSLKKQGYLISEDWTEEELAAFGQSNGIKKNLKKWTLVKENPVSSKTAKKDPQE